MLKTLEVNLPASNFEIEIVLAVVPLGRLCGFRSAQFGLGRHADCAAKQSQGAEQAAGANALRDFHRIPPRFLW
jgi:hypothetical protein